MKGDDPADICFVPGRFMEGTGLADTRFFFGRVAKGNGLADLFLFLRRPIGRGFAPQPFPVQEPP